MTIDQLVKDALRAGVSVHLEPPWQSGAGYLAEAYNHGSRARAKKTFLHPNSALDALRQCVDEVSTPPAPAEPDYSDIV